MPVRYKIDVLKSLKDAGYNTSRLRKEKIIGERTLQRIREGKDISFEVLGRLCELLQCQPADILEYVEEDNYQ
ncbi:MAG: helix-turn-helix domain-containing protein [Oscillospiraceae bacterium]|nr:helix-turn-helix domain-containing protein [Oscillospiraceae bacterium]